MHYGKKNNDYLFSLSICKNVISISHKQSDTTRRKNDYNTHD